VDKISGKNNFSRKDKPKKKYFLYVKMDQMNQIDQVNQSNQINHSNQTVKKISDIMNIPDDYTDIDGIDGIQISSFYHINSFNEIDLTNHNEKSLLVLDIDETVLMHINLPSSWLNKIHNRLSKKIIEEKYGNNVSVNKESIYDIKQQMNRINWVLKSIASVPNDIDNENLLSLLNKCLTLRIDFIFCTARKHEDKEITISQLNDIGIFNPTIYFTDRGNRGSKGDLLRTLLNNKYTNIEKVIFVDDLEVNCLSVLQCLNQQVSCYQFTRPRLKF